MNIINNIIERVERDRKDNKNPCKNYGTVAAAEKATAKMAQDAANYFYNGQGTAIPARYIVIYMTQWGRWVGAIDLTELVNRSSSRGGYLGICKGFYTF